MYTALRRLILVLPLSFHVLLAAGAETPTETGHLKYSQAFWKSAAMPGLDCCTDVFRSENFVFVNGCFPCKISIFRPDPVTGSLSFVRTWNYQPEMNAMGPTAAGQHVFVHGATKSGGIVYLHGLCFHQGGVSFGLHWYKIDPATGATTRLGGIPCGYGNLILSKDQNTLYQFDGKTNSILWYKLEPNGTPVPRGAVKGVGLVDIRGNDSATYSGHFPSTLSPDGSYLYGLSSSDNAIGWVKVESDGSLKYAASLDLKALGIDAAAAKVIFEGLIANQLSISPDGRHLYMVYQFRGATKVALFDRDEKTGGLVFRDHLPIGKSSFGMPAWIGFTPGGENGFFAAMVNGEHNVGKISWFARNPQTGSLSVLEELSTPRPSADVIRFDPRSAILDAKGTGLFIADGGCHVTGAIHVFSVEKYAPVVTTPGRNEDVSPTSGK